MSNSQTNDSRIYADINRLSKFKYFSGQFSLHPYGKAGSLLSGRHMSHYRGRGLNFEEFRHYQQGDDTRDLDWRITMRTRKPHVRVYSEEKDLPVVMLVDQRSNMFFSSEQYMKSVIAAELASLCAWRVTKESDRIGCLVFNDKSHVWFAPERNQKHTLRMIKAIESFNHQLSIENKREEEVDVSFYRALTALNKGGLRGALILMFSDMKGLDDRGKKLVQSLQAHNDVLGVRISDPMEAQLQSANHFFVTDGEQQVAIPSLSDDLANKYKQYNRSHLKRVRTMFSASGAPFIEISTKGKHLEEFRKSFSQQHTR